MTAVLIFAGMSKRFWPLTEKSFFPIAGTTLLQEQVKRLQQAGVRHILLVAGKHNAEEAKKLFPRLPIVLQKDLSLGMRGALLSALPQCGGSPVMIIGANDIIDAAAYKNLLKKSKALKDGGLILARRVKEYFPGGYLSVHNGRITGIIEKPKPGTEPSDLVNIVAHIHTSASSLLAALKSVKPTKDDGYESALASLLEKHRYEVIEYTGPWQAVKYPWHLLDLLPVLLPAQKKPKIHRSAVIHKTALVEGSVVIERGARIMAHASVIGPCTIAEGAIVANNALVRGSAIGKRSVVGYGTEIARSILADDVWTHMAYVGDSIIGPRTSLGGGTITGNLRLDEGVIASMVQEKLVPTHRTKLGAMIGADVRMGIHGATSPGVKVGARTFLNSGVLVTEDIPDDSFVKEKGKNGLDIRKNRINATSIDRSHLRKKLT